MTSFRIAVRRDYAKKDDENATDFFDVNAWRATAEFVCKYFKKGSLIQVVGHIENRRWTDKYEQTRISTEIIADKVYFGDSKGKDENTGAFDPFEGEAGSSGADVSSIPSGFDPFA